MFAVEVRGGWDFHLHHRGSIRTYSVAKMSVQYHASTGTNMDIEESQIGSKQFLWDGSSWHNSDIVLRNSSYRVATVCLGLLCVLMLAGIIGQSIQYQKVEKENQDNVKVIDKEKENLQDSLKSVQKEKEDIEAKRIQLQRDTNVLSQKRDQIQTNNNLLSEEMDKLKLSQSQLETTNKALNKNIEQLRASKSRLDTNYNVLSAAKELLQIQYDTVVKRKDELQGSHDSVTRERDNLHNQFNNVTRSKEKLQMSYNDLIKDIEHLQERYNASTGEKDTLANTHQNLTTEINTLQENFNSLKKAADTLRVNYVSLAREKKELQSNLNNVTAEGELLMVKIRNLTAERDNLQGLVDKMNKTMQDRICVTGWQKFECSCYYTSYGNRTWQKSREYCQSKGADLAIITSQNEMNFINGLFEEEKQSWIGLTDEGVEGVWKWVDGTPLTLAFWAADQPNSYKGTDQDCVDFWHRAPGKGVWNDQICTAEQNFICEM
ncbi:C-type lectin domain family 4 member M isoform X1 [Pleuronectes platessa]|uniref:C-type lectin domain family 4 member M isoform X1 n=1 Tax=Pleuronectes platessa TaxID=8262 RepID=UPI00232A5E2B|nr:C-type lectin domain family 4 member M isoform X1 [Pleuronectes platessa]